MAQSHFLSHSLAHTYQRDLPGLLCAGFHAGCVHVLPLNWTPLWNHSDSRCESRCDCCDCLWINDAFVMNWQPVRGVSCPVHYGTHSSVLFGISTLQSVWIHPQWQDEFINTPDFSRWNSGDFECLLQFGSWSRSDDGSRVTWKGHVLSVCWSSFECKGHFWADL